MKNVATFALVVLACVPARAQYGGMGGMGGAPATQSRSIEVEFLEMEQEADKTAHEKAALQTQTQVQEAIEENLGSEDPKEWNWKALSGTPDVSPAIAFS